MSTRLSRMVLIVLTLIAAPAAVHSAETCRGLAATIIGTAGNDQLRGTAGDDVIVGLGGNDTIRGEGGNDTICGGPGNDTIFGDDGDDSLWGDDDNDVIRGGDGNDRIDGGTGRNNTLHGDEGFDVCTNGTPHKCESEAANNPPVANAGPDRSGAVGSRVELDGSGSSDPDGDALTYRWTFKTRAPGSSATLDNASAQMPTFVIDQPGVYVLELIVNDGSADSGPDEASVVTINTAPVARAGADQSVFPGATVTLDGSGSSDVDHDPLSYTWILTPPAGSAATLINPNAVGPTFVADKRGQYEATLTVSDGSLTSASDTVVISAQNRRPVANAGADQSVFRGATVTLNGGGSDPDNDPITFLWTLSRPAGSSAVLSDATAQSPTFAADAHGTYTATLVVNDGLLNSAADSATIVVENRPPVANAGSDQTVFRNATVTLSGSGTDPDNDALTFTWTMTSRPTGSIATLSNPSSQTPTFTADAHGSYEISLIVSDGLADSAADVVVVTVQNRPPIANAGADQSVFRGATVTLNGSGTDPDGDPLTFSWALRRPAGSSAVLSDASAHSPTFVADVHGTYEASLMVNDGLANSAPDLAVIVAQNRAPVANAGADQIVFKGSTVTLAGSGTDPDNDPITFSWTLVTRPAGSNAALSNPSAQSPTFLADVHGTYEVSLVVNDGMTDSGADIVVIATQNRAPIANAGADQSVFRGTTVTLIGSGTDRDNDPIVSFRWQLTSRPVGSNASLSNVNAQWPTFVADVHGQYEATLIVNDGLADSAPDVVLIFTQNRLPVANAGSPQTADVADLVTLNGSGSDPDSDPITFHWTFVRPVGSTATLSSSNIPNPTFVPDVAGDYVATLVLNDGLADSAPSSVTITVFPPAIQLELVGTPFLGVGRTAQIRVVLPQPAPASGVTVTVTSANSAILSVNAPGTVFIAGGLTTGIVSATGVTPGPALLRANAAGYREGTATLTVTDKLVNLPEAFSVPLGQQTNLVVSIAPHPAPAGGVTIRLTTSDETIIGVSASVTILPGQFSATAIVTGVRPGTAIVTAENPDYATDSVAVSTAAQLNITQGSISFFGGFPAQITVRLETSTGVVPAPSPGLNVTMSSANPECATASSFLLETGLSTRTVSIAYGGTAPRPCTTTMTASSPGVGSDTLQVTVSAPPNITFLSFPTTVGSGMISTGTRLARLGASNHGGATVRIESLNPSLALVSNHPSIAGTASFEVTLTNTQTDVVVVVHALENVTGTATIRATADRYNAGQTTASIVQPAARIINVDTPIDTFDPPGLFNVQIGPRNPTGTDLADVQSIRPGGVSVTVNVTSSNAAAGTLEFGTASGASVPVVFDPGVAATSGNITFRPVAAGSTTLTSESPAGWGTVNTRAAGVTVTTPGIGFVSYPTTVGSGMTSTGNRHLRLGASQHGGKLVRIESLHPALALVSFNAGTVGQAAIEQFLPNGTIDLFFVVHGLENVTGVATIRVTAAGFNNGDTTVTIAQPAARVINVDTPIDTLDPPGLFNVQIGPRNPAGTDLLDTQVIRPGGVPVTVNITSSNTAAGVVELGTASGGSIPYTFNPLASATTPNITFRPIGAGSTTVAVEGPAGYGTINTRSVLVQVTTPGIGFVSYPTTVGAGMHSTGNRHLRLGASQHGGRLVRIESLHPALALVSFNAATVGQTAIEQLLPNGSIDLIFVVHALEGVTGTATIRVTAPGFTAGQTTVTIAQPGARLVGVDTPIDTLDPNGLFQVQIGPRNSTGTDLADVQNIRPGGTPVTVVVNSSDPTVGEVILGAASGASVPVPFTVGQSVSPNLTFRQLRAGSTTLSITPPPLYGTVNTGMVPVTVTTPGIGFISYPTTVGAGLISSGTRHFRLGASQHGGKTVRVESSNPQLALVSRDANTTGTAFVDVPVANGAIDGIFYVHALENHPDGGPASGNVIITASTFGFTDGNTTVTILPAALRIVGLNNPTTLGAADDLFTVQIGPPDATGATLIDVQNVRPGGTAKSVTITSGTPAVGLLALASGGAGAASQSLILNPGQAQLNFFFRAVGRGTTQLTTTGPAGVSTTTAGRPLVTVN